MNNAEYKEFLKKWDQLIYDFNKWSIDNPLKEIFNKKFIFMNLSLWWCSNFINRSNVQNPQWFEDLFFIKYNIKKNKTKRIPLVYLTFFKSFFSTLSTFLISKYFLKNNIVEKNIQKTIWFHSLSYNFQDSSNVCFDRLYKKTPLDDFKYESKSSYIIKIFITKKFFLNINKEISKLNYKIKSLKRNAYVVDKSLYLTDILYVYWISFWYLFKIKLMLFFMRKDKYESLFVINNTNFKDILEPLLISSFSGPIPRSLLYGISMKRFFRNKGKNQKIVTYGELLPGIRPVYHFLDGLRKEIKIASIQHAWINPYKVEHIFHKEDFNGSSQIKALKYSPRPNLLLTQGELSSKLYRNFFPNNDIKIIGCLKYDDEYFENLQSKNKIRDIEKKLALSSFKKNILITPSIGDEYEIINLFKKFKQNDYRIILSPHPSVFDETIDFFKKSLEEKLTIEHYKEFSSIELLGISDCIVGCKSVLLIEAAIAGVPAIRICSNKFRPSHGFDDIVPLAFNTVDLENLLKSQENKDYFQKDIKKQLNDNFFGLYETNGKDLLWNSINKM
tara:strand:+ start:7388 stop:9064 length:1677 start_codon:yes stop_codon:yes gene_type:complete